jgi:hypothetical protein
VYLIVLVVDDPNTCGDILAAWEKIGIPGATILDSVGMQRIRQHGITDNIPLMPSLSDLLKLSEIRHRTIFSVVPDKTMVKKVVEITQDVIGDFNDKNTGFMFTVKVEEVFGLQQA